MSEDLVDVLADKLLTDETRARSIVTARLFRGLAHLLIEKGLLNKDEILAMSKDKRSILLEEHASINVDAIAALNDAEREEALAFKARLSDLFLDSFDAFDESFES